VITQIPSFIMGYPTFNRLKALNYIKRQLELAGFDVFIMGDFHINITWKIKKTHVEPSAISTEEFPTLINLKKAANQYRRDAQNGQ